MIHSKEIVALGSQIYNGRDLIYITDDFMLKFFKLYKNYVDEDGDFAEFYFFEILKSNEN